MVDVKCDFCEVKAHGTIDELINVGWQKAIIDTTIGKERIKKTVIACKDHRGEFHKSIMAAFKPETKGAD